jgi:hypothetical protein
VAEFTTSLTNFQKVQRQAAEREKEFVARVRASSRVSVSMLNGVNINLVFFKGLLEVYISMIL